MNRAEWELLRKFDRKLSYVAKVCSEVENNSESIKALRCEIDEMKDVVTEFRKILFIRKQVRKVLFWVLTITLSAGITTFVTERTSLYLPAREEGLIIPSKVDTTNGSLG
jgi:hypothetical protein